MGLAALAICFVALLFWLAAQHNAAGGAAASAPPRPSDRSYSSYIAGTMHDGPSGPRAPYIWKQVRPGDRLTLLAEPENEYDSDAVGLWHHGFHVGYIPARHDWVARSIREGDCHDVIVEGMTRSDDDPRIPFVTLRIGVSDRSS